MKSFQLKVLIQSVVVVKVTMQEPTSVVVKNLQ